MTMQSQMTILDALATIQACHQEKHAMDTFFFGDKLIEKHSCEWIHKFWEHKYGYQQPKQYISKENYLVFRCFSEDEENCFDEIIAVTPDFIHGCSFKTLFSTGSTMMFWDQLQEMLDTHISFVKRERLMELLRVSA